MHHFPSRFRKTATPPETQCCLHASVWGDQAASQPGKGPSMSIWFFFLCQFSVVGYALLGGVFLAFSDFIMRSLAHTSGRGGIEAMQVINREVFRYVFMALFLGLVPVSLVLAGYATFVFSGAGATLVALSGMIYLVGVFGITLVCNVPLNEALARMDLTTDDTQRFWTDTYLPRWTFWNSVRTTACTVACALLLLGLLRMAQA